MHSSHVVLITVTQYWWASLTVCSSHQSAQHASAHFLIWGHNSHASWAALVTSSAVHSLYGKLVTFVCHTLFGQTPNYLVDECCLVVEFMHCGQLIDIPVWYRGKTTHSVTDHSLLPVLVLSSSLHDSSLYSTPSMNIQNFSVLYTVRPSASMTIWF